MRRGVRFGIAMTVAAACLRAPTGRAEDPMLPEDPLAVDEAPPAMGPAYVVPITGVIGRETLALVTRALRTCKDKGYPTVVFVIDSPGGHLVEAMEISEQIQQAPIAHKIAFVETKALSAGALLALSCDRLVMREGTEIGDCIPVTFGADGIPVELPEKIVRPLVARMRSLAELHGYPVALAEGMVDKNLEVYELTDPASHPGLPRFVTDRDLAAAGLDPATIAKRTVSPRGEIVTLTALQAEAYGLAEAVARDLPEACGRLGIPADQLHRIAPLWSERFISFVTSPGITMLLIAIGLMGIYTEFSHPGFGLPGAAGVACFAVLFAGHYLGGYVEYWELILFLLGLALLGLEVFVLPGFGVAGVSGIVLVILSLALATMQPVTGGAGALFAQLPGAVARTLGGVGLSAIGFLGLLALAPRLPGGRRLVLETPAGTAATGASHGEARSPLVGRTGATLTPLRPAGKARIDDAVYDVASDGDYLEAGTPVVVVAAAPGHLVVRKA